MPVRDIRHSKMSHNEILNLGARFLEKIKDADSSDKYYLPVLVNFLETDTETYKDSLNRTRKSEYTNQVREKDNDRDDAFELYRGTIELSIKSKDTNKKLASTLLISKIREINYSLHNQGDSDQTADTLKLINSIENDSSAVDAMNTLGITGLWEDFKTAQDEFEKTYSQRIDETEIKKELPWLWDARSSLIQILKAVVTYVNVKERDDSAKFSSIALSLDEIIKEIESNADARITREKSGDLEN